MKILVPVKRVVDYNVKVRVKATKKPVKSSKPEGLDVDVSPPLKTLNEIESAACKAGIKVPDVPPLIDKLKNEAKWLPNHWCAGVDSKFVTVNQHAV